MAEIVAGVFCGTGNFIALLFHFDISPYNLDSVESEFEFYMAEEMVATCENL